MARALLTVVLQDQEGDVQASRTLTLYELDGTTPLAQTVYDAPTGGNIVVSPTTNSLGTARLYVANAQRIKLAVSGVAGTVDAEFSPDPSDVVTLAGTQTLTNKTLTAPTLTTPTMTDAVLTRAWMRGNSGTNGIYVDSTGKIGMIESATGADIPNPNNIVVIYKQTTGNEILFDCLLESTHPGTTLTTGTATSGSSTTLTQTGAGWTVNAYTLKHVVFLTGAGSTQPPRTILSNTSDTLTFTPALLGSDLPASGTTFRIVSAGDQGASRFFMRGRPGNIASIRAVEAHGTRDRGTGNTGVTGIEIGCHPGVEGYTDQYNTGAAVGAGEAGWLPVGVTGTATAGGASTLTDSSKTWIVNDYVLNYVDILTGTGAGQRRRIVSNTSTQLTVLTPWATQPDATSTYQIGTGVQADTGVYIYGDLGWKRYWAGVNYLGSKMAECIEDGSIASAGKGTFGTITHGTAGLTVKQATANALTTGLQVLRYDDADSGACVYGGGDNNAYIQALADGVGGSFIAVGGATSATALVVGGVTGHSGLLFQAQNVSGTARFQVRNGGEVRALGKGTFGSVSADGGGTLNVKQPSNDLAGGIRTIKSDDDTRYGSLYVDGSGDFYVQQIGTSTRYLQFQNAADFIFTPQSLDVGGAYYVDSVKVVGNQGAAVADATGAGDVVAQLNALLARVRAHGLIAT